jgi:hypothetical protein
MHTDTFPHLFSDGLNRKLIINSTGLRVQNNIGLRVQPHPNSEHSQKSQNLAIQGTTSTIDKSQMYDKSKSYSNPYNRPGQALRVPGG